MDANARLNARASRGQPVATWGWGRDLLGLQAELHDPAIAAFAGLANATGAAKAKLLAQSISTALWTTCIGLIIAVPALLFFTYYKNLATRILLETEATVLDLIKVLRNAEVEQ